ncbi:MAG: TIGR04282 family arsenosugar biosynthesis glycosyltransferase [Rhodospirillales bacterium]|nr:TIGR04282 family arsenosugar biosynthesis glycosyltransferase [Rhodospirillales bacterium]
MKQNRHLVVFAKEPLLGQVKTRLGRDIGTVAATRFYRRILSDVTRRLGQEERWRCWLSLSPDSAINRHPFWPSSFQPVKQGGGDIGQRMDRAMRQMPSGPVVIIGTDVPAIRPDHIENAFKALGHHDAVFGPAADGGYWLVGARRSPRTPDLFSNVRWSSEHTLADTLNTLQKNDVKVALLETLDDVDEGAAYRRWQRLSS